MDDERTSPSDAARQDAFKKHLEKASEIVNRWPSWKRAIVGGERSENSSAKEHERASECSDNDRNGNGKG